MITKIEDRERRVIAAPCIANVQSWVLLWDTQTGKRLMVIKPGQYTVNGLAFSPDSSLLATGDLIGRVPMKIWRLPDTF